MARADTIETGSVGGLLRGREPPRSGSSKPDLSLTIAIERVAQIKDELDVLARLEHDEMEKGFRPYGPDWHSLSANEQMGTLKMLVARKKGEMVGYMCWMLDFDIEAYGVLIAQQGAWYVKPGNYGVAVRMFDWAMNEFRHLGVKFVYLHNAERGRGRTLGKFFVRRGAVHTSNVYTLAL